MICSFCMLTKFLQSATHFLSNPAHASRMVMVSFGTVGLMAAMYQVGNVQLLKSDALGAASAPAAGAASGAAASGGAAPAASSAATAQQAIADCRTGAIHAEELMTRMAASFGGPLPGAAKLLADNGATVGVRRGQLVQRVLDGYKNLKYCYDKNSSTPYHTYISMNSQASNGAPTLTGSDSMTASIDRDLTEKRALIDSTIGSAIDAANQTDAQTTLNSIANKGKTDSQSADYQSKMMQALIENSNTQIDMMATNSALLDKIANIQAFDHAGTAHSGMTFDKLADTGNWQQHIASQTGLGGGQEEHFAYSNTYFNQPVSANPGKKQAVIPPVRDGAQDAVQGALKGLYNSDTGEMKFRYGILNLVPEEALQPFLDGPFRKAVLAYSCAESGKNCEDPATGADGAAAKVPIINKEQISAMFCDLGSAGADPTNCFGVALP